MNFGGLFRKFLAGDITDANFLSLIDNLHSEGVFNIHLDPLDDSTLVRLRQGKNLVSAGEYKNDASEKFTRYVKARSGLKAHRSRSPEEGGFICGDFLVKIYSLPVIDGEKISLKTAKSNGKIKDLRELGLWGDGLKAVQGITRLSGGLVFALGKGSLQTMFSMLARFDAHITNLATIEHLQTVNLPLVNQFVAEQNYDELAEKALRVAMRQNADVIMISRIDTPKLAELALEASLSGKLVIAGLPIDDSFLVPSYIAHLGVRPFLVSSQLRLIVGQSLVPAAPVDALRLIKITPGRSTQILTDVSIDAQGLHKLEKQAKKAGLSQHLPLSSSEKHITRLYQTAPKNLTRLLAIFEVIEANETTNGYFLPGLRPKEIRNTFIASGGITKELDYLAKALRGLLPYDVS
ncbi:MAG: Flp pilus assembly complex ATPase component TadA [Candidatus Nomurabacteria bacterium]|jgi:type II secretory ATPase GspE/PulE/Tfp pilus assembly ATPase PilB-like protein|nr:Flp pilus assembly complex ATPase component TadA [Candidatus Nomurabacteria bacterium]